jgi:hypothetical protein
MPSRQRSSVKRKGKSAKPRRPGGARKPATKPPNAATQAITLALAEVQRPPEPRARMRLRAVMRKIGLDEWVVAWLLNFKIHLLAESQKSTDNKLLLDYLKEAARHLDPASARAAAQENAPIEIVHDVPRPNRDEIVREVKGFSVS